MSHVEIIKLCFQTAYHTRWPDRDFRVDVWADADRYQIVVRTFVFKEGTKIARDAGYVDQRFNHERLEELIRYQKPIMPNDETIATLMLYIG